MANEGYSAPFALQEILTQKRAVQHQKLLDSLNVVEAQAQIEDRVQRRKNDAAQLQALIDNRKSLEDEREYRRAQNLAQYMPEGAVEPDTAAVLGKHGFGGLVVKRPGGPLEVPAVTEGFPEGGNLGGSPAQPVSRQGGTTVQLPETLTSPGGTNVQAAKALVAARLAQQRDAQGAKAELTASADAARAERADADRENRKLIASIVAASRRESGTQNPVYLFADPDSGKAVFASEGQTFTTDDAGKRVLYTGKAGMKPSVTGGAKGPSSAEFINLSKLAGKAAATPGRVYGTNPAKPADVAAYNQALDSIVARYQASPDIIQGVLAALEEDPSIPTAQIIEAQKQSGATPAELAKFAEILTITRGR